MKSLLFVTTVGAFLATIGCGDGSAKGKGGSSAGGAGGISANGSGGSVASATGGSRSTGGTSGTSGSDASVSDSADTSASAGKCPQAAAAPCGGNVVGTWTLKIDDCVFPPSSAYCPGMTFSMDSASNYSVTYVFNADNTLNASMAGNVISTTRYPSSCISSDAGAADSCARFSKELQTIAQQITDAGTYNMSTATYACSADPDGTCVCDAKVSYVPNAVTGSYTTNGTKIVITALGTSDAGVLEPNADSPTDYCVSGNTLTLWPASSSTSSKPTVLTR